MADSIMEKKGLVRRHGPVELVEHWAMAISGIALIITGLLELPVGRRYYITEIPGFSWADDFFATLSLHYGAAVLFVAVALFHIFYHGLLGQTALLPRRGDLKSSITVIKAFFGRGEEPPFEKYLPEQRLAYAGMLVIIGMLILSGLVKTYVNHVNPQLSYGITLLASWVHTLSFVLFILAVVSHVGALALQANRPLVRGMFTGSVRLDYVQRRHPLWIRDLEKCARNEYPVAEPGVQERGAEGPHHVDEHLQQPEGRRGETASGLPDGVDETPAPSIAQKEEPS